MYLRWLGWLRYRVHLWVGINVWVSMVIVSIGSTVVVADVYFLLLFFFYLLRQHCFFFFLLLHLLLQIIVFHVHNPLKPIFQTRKKIHRLFRKTIEHLLKAFNGIICDLLTVNNLVYVLQLLVTVNLESALFVCL
jgi:hypothetical protein